MSTVADIMDADPVTVAPDTDVETVIKTLKEHELSGIPVVEAGRCVGIITEEDLVIGDEQGDLHLPHFIELFGGVVFLEPLSRFDDRLRKATASTARDMMTADPKTIEPGASLEKAAKLIAKTRHNRIPVTDDGTLVGVVTRLDVLQALAGE